MFVLLLLHLTYFCPVMVRGLDGSYYHYHFKHYKTNTPGNCDNKAHHVQHVFVGRHGGCETLDLRADQCVEILRNDCFYEFFTGDRCRGYPTVPNRGEMVGSVRVMGCSSENGHGFRLGGGRKIKQQIPPDTNYIEPEEPKRKGKRIHHHHKESYYPVKDETPWYWR